MSSQSSPSPNNRKRDLYRYASLGTQIMAALAVAVFLGLKADGWLHTMPLFSCLLPLLILFVLFYKLVRETGNKKNNGSK
jgi:F0F1-type ATP synthase assembly protein I